MIRRILSVFIDKAERSLGVSSEYTRYILAQSVPSFLKFSSATLWADHHKALPPVPYYLAKIAAYRIHDCGECLQISVNLARKAGLPGHIVQAAVEGRVTELPAAARDVYRYAELQAERTDSPELRERIREAYGDEALIELAIGIASAAVFPTVKRALGYATSCSRVRVHAGT